MKRIFALALVAAALTAGESRASCGLLSRLFGRGGCGSASTVRTLPACQGCNASAIKPAEHREIPASIPATSPDCPSGNCPAAKSAPNRRFFLIK